MMTTEGRDNFKPLTTWNNLGLRTMDWLIGSLMIVSSWLHLRNHMMFYLQVAEYRIIPAQVLPFFALTVPWLMLFAGMMIIVRAGHPVGAVVGVAVFIMFGIAQAWAILNKYDIDCGCFGSVAQKKIGVLSMLLPFALAVGCVVIALSRSRKSMPT